METEKKDNKVLVLWYPEPNGSKNQMHGICTVCEISERGFIDRFNMYPAVYTHNVIGNVKMYYTKQGGAQNIKLDDITVGGGAVFVAFENNKAVNISTSQVRRIKLKVKDLWLKK